jgi:hypothetical protein
MASIQQRILIAPLFLPAFLSALSATNGPRFLPDDPLFKEPAPAFVAKALDRDMDNIYDLVENTFIEPHRVKPQIVGPRSSRNVNTVGDVPDSAWYTNRHWLRPMSTDELVKGPGNMTPPDATSAWRIVSGKSDGVMPGFVVADAHGNRYVLKFDPPQYPELSTAADVIGSKFFHALGYNTPENYIVRFRRDQLALSDTSSWHDSRGRKRRLTNRVVDDILKNEPKDARGRFRAIASRYIPGQLIGPFRYDGTRKDDPNDVVAHEDRRELRGLKIFCAWLNHTDSKSVNTLDTMVQEDGRRFIKHYLIDFGAILGSDSFAPKDPRLGHEYFIDPKPTAWQIVTLGLHTPGWTRASFPHFPGAGNLESDVFDPVKWKGNYPNPAFLLVDDEDAYWAAKQIASFTDDQIRAIVATGEYSDRRTAEYVAACIARRRDKIVQAYLRRVLPIDRFRVENGRLRFTDMSKSLEGDWTVRWSAFDNMTSKIQPLSIASTFDIREALHAAPGAEFVSAKIQSSARPGRSTIVYLRRTGASASIVGVDRK